MGCAVTAEAAPHHFTLTDELLAGYDPIYKVNPPLRTAADIAAVRAGLADGTIDAIATDHAPHAAGDQGAAARRGAARHARARDGARRRARRTSTCRSPTSSPRCRGSRRRSPGVADRHGRPIAAGEPANLTVFDPEVEWEVQPARLASKSRNTPYVGTTLRGRVRHTIFGGDPVVVDGEAQR